MNRKLLLIVLGLVVVLLATPYIGTVYAKPSTPVSGTQTLNNFIPLGPPAPEGKSANALLIAMVDVTWAGDIAGHTVYEGKLMLHNFVLPAGGPDTTTNIHERIFFQTVNVLGKTGSLTLVVNLGGSKGVFRWNILSGTDELANLHGNGVYYQTGVSTYAYEGEVHFDP